MAMSLAVCFGLKDAALAEGANESISVEVQQILAQSSNQAQSNSNALSLNDLIDLLKDKNVQIKTSELATQTSDAEILSAESAFDTQLDISASRSRTSQQNDIADTNTQNTSVFESDNDDVTMEVSRLVATGADVSANIGYSKFLTSSMRALNADEPDNVRLTYGVSVSQPLLKGAGIELNQIPIEVAQIGKTVAKANLKDTTTITYAQAAILYYDLVLAQKRVAVFEEKVQMGKMLLKIATEMQQKGRLSESEVWDVENALSQFNSALSNAQQNQLEQAASLQSLVQQPYQAGQGPMVVDEALITAVPHVPNFEESVTTAFEQRADLLARKLELDQSKKTLRYEENNMLPDLDLVASYGRDGLENDLHNSVIETRKNGPTWTVGVQFSMKLGEDRSAKAGILAAKVSSKETELAIEGLKVSIANDVKIAIQSLENSKKLLAEARKMLDRELKRVDLEMERFNAGRSELRAVLRQRERAIDSKFLLVEQQIAAMKGHVVYRTAVGTFIDQFN